MKNIPSVCVASRAPGYGVCFFIFCTLAVATTLMLSAPDTAFAEGQGPIYVPEKYMAGRVLIQPRPGLSPEKLDNIISEHGGRRIFLIEPINLHIIELPPQANAPAIAAALSRNPHLKFVELDGALQPDFYPNDPYYSSSWHLPKIGAPTAWDSAQGTGVTIAILDTGVDTTQPDLQSQLVPGWNFYDANDDVTDVHGHGTAVAGIVAAAGNNGVGGASVSFQSRIMPMRITDPAGYGYYSLMAQALTAAADYGARVANISFRNVSLSSSVDSAAQYMRSKGGVVVIAAGNTGNLLTDPPRDSLTAVAATDSNDARATFSSWGDYVDAAAPGISILTTTQGGGYGSMTGTSAASPIVAGVYALMMSANSALQPATLDSTLLSTALDLGTTGFDPYYGYGRVRAANAVAEAGQTSGADSEPPTVEITSPGGGNVSGLVPVDVTATDNVAVTRVELYVNGSLVATDAFAPYGFTLDSTQYADGQVNLQARAYDAAGNSASSSTVLVTVANDTTPPAVAIQNPADGSVVSGTVTISVNATDNQQVAKIALSIDGREVAVWHDSSSLSYQWRTQPPRGKGKKQGPASSTISATAEDIGGNAATATATVTVTR
ncbi:MAG: S8 family serine peptidase [Gammaproteobacteria bacterium]|nr:S8 family serine peptidase [Gammaproteobacteria bacterium]